MSAEQSGDREPAIPGTGAAGDLAGNSDRERWNARHQARTLVFAPHPLTRLIFRSPAGAGLPAGPVLELACGASGSALLAAAAGRDVTAVDVSEVALGQLAAEAARRGLDARIRLVQADLTAWSAPAGAWALVLCTRYWDADVFGRAAAAVRAGGLLAWDALTGQARAGRPGLNQAYCLRPGEPACLLPPGFDVLEQADQPGGTRRLLARRAS